jgi:hypothetical protein
VLARPDLTVGLKVFYHQHSLGLVFPEGPEWLLLIRVVLADSGGDAASMNSYTTNPYQECDGTGWVLYLSEAAEGGLEEAYRLCPECCAPRCCMGSGKDRFCPRPATVCRGEVYLCEEHAVYRLR